MAIIKKHVSSGLLCRQPITRAKTRLARALRRRMTRTEKILWEKVRNRKLAGLKFHRQLVIKGYIADFYCESIRLVVEVDGGVHDNPEQKDWDKNRDAVFKDIGLNILRIKNKEIEENLSAVLERIKAANAPFP